MLPPPGFEPFGSSRATRWFPCMRPRRFPRDDRGSPKATAGQSGRRLSRIESHVLPPPGFEPFGSSRATRWFPCMRSRRFPRDDRGSPKATAGQSGRCVVVPSSRPAPDRNHVRAEAERCCPRCGQGADRRDERGSPQANAGQSGRCIVVPSLRPAQSSPHISRCT